MSYSNYRRGLIKPGHLLRLISTRYDRSEGLYARKLPKLLSSDSPTPCFMDWMLYPKDIALCISVISSESENTDWLLCLSENNIGWFRHEFFTFLEQK